MSEVKLRFWRRWSFKSRGSGLWRKRFGGLCWYHHHGEVNLEAASTSRNVGILPQHYTASQPRRQLVS